MDRLNKIKTIEKPWGEEIWFAMTGDYLGKILMINPNQQVSEHYHEHKEETFFVWQGPVEITIKYRKNEIATTYQTGDRVHILPVRTHTMRALNKKVILFEVSTSFPEDSVRIKDFYGRECIKSERQSEV